MKTTELMRKDWDDRARDDSLLGFRGVSCGVASLLGLSPEIAGKSWRDASLDVRNGRETVESANGEVKEMTGERTPMTWCYGKKSRAEAQ
jgi:hypothetical protein